MCPLCGHIFFSFFSLISSLNETAPGDFARERLFFSYTIAAVMIAIL